MQTSNHYIPPGAGVLAPYLIVKDANAALEFYREAFGAVEVERLNTPDGRTMHAELKIGGAMLMLGEYPGVETPPAGGFPALSLYLYVPDVDSTVEKAARRGAGVFAPPQAKI
jgi:PhnB protein